MGTNPTLYLYYYMKYQLIILGTGHATVTSCYNTCFIVSNQHDYLLVDAGGGNGIFRQLEQVNISLKDIHHLFITHAHTDHIFGCVWVVRLVMQQMIAGKYEGCLHVYSHDKALNTLLTICQMTMHKEYNDYIGQRIFFHELKDGDTFQVGEMSFQAFDICSDKEKQFGFRMQMDDGRSLVCLGDEPYNPLCKRYVEHADWLMLEAFCLYEDRDIFHPYEKYHSTAMDAGKIAQSLHIKNLLLYHTEDHRLVTRKEDYTAEAGTYFEGNIIVPDDLETVDLL